MAQPTEITESWQALAEAVGTPDQPTTETQAFLSWCQAGGYSVHVNADGITVEQPAGVDAETGQASRDAAWRVEQVG